MNDIEYTGEAPGLKDLISRLFGVRLTDHYREQTDYVAGHLLKFVLRDQWGRLPKRQQKLLVKPSSDRLWNYMQKGKDLGLPTKQVAEEAIAEELKILTKTLAPKK